jgi:ABC-type oligopeptide transport system ATPase subunit
MGMGEFCSMKILCETRHGKIYTCSGCDGKIVFAFKNITQSMEKEYFQKFEKNISALQFGQYFQDFPQEKRIHIRTEWDNLFYSFTINEISEVQSLFQQANFKLKLFERYALFLN